MARRTVVPDRAALEIAHGRLESPTSLDDMLKTPNLKAVVTALARRHMQRRAQVDVKKLQANDND